MNAAAIALAAMLAALVAGCVGMPDCNDDWIEDSLIEWYAEDDGKGIFSWLAGILDDRISPFRNQEFAVVGARIVGRIGVDSATCEASIHGRKLTDSGELRQGIEALEELSYEVSLTADGAWRRCVTKACSLQPFSERCVWPLEMGYKDACYERRQR